MRQTSVNHGVACRSGPLGRNLQHKFMLLAAVMSYILTPQREVALFMIRN